MEMLRTRGRPFVPRLKDLSAGHLKTAAECPRYGASGESWVRITVLVSEAPPGAPKLVPPVKSSHPSTQVLFEFERVETLPPSRLPTNRPPFASAYNCHARTSCR